MGAEDNIVPNAQGDMLKDRIEVAGRGEQFQLFTYQGRDHQRLTIDNPKLHQRIREFLNDL